MKKNIKNGFTLIEIVVYLALFAILFTGVVIGAYNVIESSNRTQTKAMLQEEGNFLISKINWTLSGAQAINSPGIGSSGSLLSVTKSTGAVVISSSVTDMDISTPTISPAQPLNNSNTGVSNILFTHKSAGGAEWIDAGFTLTARTPDGKILTQGFNTTNYLRR